MNKNVLSALQKHFDEAATDGLLPQNLPTPLLENLVSALRPRDVSDKSYLAIRERLAGPIFCVGKIMDYQNNNTPGEYDIETFGEFFQIYTVCLMLEIAARKHRFEIKPPVTLSDIFSPDREISISSEVFQSLIAPL